jgi:hypothetical protein
MLSSYISNSKFKRAVDMVESSDGSPWLHTATKKIVFNELFPPSDHAAAKSNNSSEYQMATTEAHHCYLVALFFHSLGNESHHELKKKNHNNALTGTNSVF